MTTPYTPSPADQQSGSPDQQSGSPATELPPVPKATRTLLFVAVAAHLVVIVATILRASYYDFSLSDLIVSSVLILVTGVLALIAAVQVRQRVPLAVSVTLAVVAALLFIHTWLDELSDMGDAIDYLKYTLRYGAHHDYEWLVIQVGTTVTFGTVVAALPNLIKYRRPKLTPPASAEPLYQVLYNAEGEKVLVPAGPATGTKSFVATVLLCFFLGNFGAHRFYTGKIGTGILQLLTLGGLGIWAFVDFIMILVGAFKDKKGLALAR